MKKSKICALLAVLSLFGSASQATTLHRATAPPTTINALADDPGYEQGAIDGNDQLAVIQANYTYGTPEYREALDAAVAYSSYQARHSEEPIYWRGYTHALVLGYP